MVEHGFFVSAGRRLATVTHRPPGFGSGSHRAAVLAHGLANDYDEAGQFPPLAERLAEEGFVVLRFDFRGGRRDSLAGRQLPATEWTHDLRSAIAHTRTRAGVDPERLVVIGASAGGAVALSVAHLEPTLKGVASLGSPANGSRWFRDLWTRIHGPSSWNDFISQLDEDRRHRTTGAPSRLVRLIGEFLPINNVELEAAQEFVDGNPGMLDELPLEVADDLLLLRPEAVVAEVAVPVLVAHGALDTLVPPGEAERLAKGAQSRLLIVEKQPHQLLLGPGGADVIELLVEFALHVTRGV
jgi:pimeloyl-ACP methyl ester carboxylesterase